VKEFFSHRRPYRALFRGLSLSAILVASLAVADRWSVSDAAHAESARPSAAAVPAVLAAQTAPAALPPRLAGQAVPAVLSSKADGLSPKVLAMALDTVAAARARGLAGRADLLTVIDYSLPSTTPRLWVLDLAHGKVLFHELVAHGRGSGDVYATQFSNLPDSLQSSLGLYLTAGTYEGHNGYSLRLRGLDKGFNDRAEQRSVVMHGAWYVSAEHARDYGRLGRSWGCPALSEAMARPVIDTIKNGSFLFAYGGDPAWLRTAQGTQTAAVHEPAAKASEPTAKAAP
jgi:L,D-transpeptidase-like protein